MARQLRCIHQQQIAHVAPEMTDISVKGKEKESIREAETPEAELTEAEKKRRSFERSLAGPSVGKAGLIRDQTGMSSFVNDAHCQRSIKS